MYEFGAALYVWREWAGKVRDRQPRALSRDRLALDLNMGKSYLGKAERGELPSRIKESTKERIWRYFGCESLDEFLAGPQKVASPSTQLQSQLSPEEVTVMVYKQSNLSPDWSDCGEPISAPHVHAPGRDLIAALVETAAMYPAIPRGSIVMVDRKIIAPEEGKIGMFWANSRAVIRRFAYAAAAGMASLQALDPEVAPIEVPLGALICMGLVYRVIADPN